MEQLGLGVRLSLDDDMTSEINPIIRDMERLRRQAQRTTTTFNDMRNAHNPFGRNRRQEIKDYHDSMGSLDRVLLNISDRFIRATKSANAMGKAINRAQFSGNFNYMYKDIMRVQRMLGNMGYGMSKLQKEMSNLRAYQMMDVTIKDLHDKIKLTEKALKEMQKSPDASKMVKEMNIAKRSLQAYQNELKRTGSLQDKLTQTHGLGKMKSFTGKKDILYEEPKSAKEMFKNQMSGLAMTDMALASAIATKSLNKTEDALIGTGYSALEAKQKLMQMSTAMQTLGLTLTTTLSLVSALAMGGMGYLAGKEEKANSQFTGQTLMPIGDAKMYQSSMRNSYGNSSGSDREVIARQYSTMNNAGMTDTGAMERLSKGANEIGYAQGVDSLEVLNSVMSIAKKTGNSYADSLDLISLGLKSTDGDLEGATEAVLKNAGAFKDANGQWKNAFETLEQGNQDGSINRLIQAGKGLANTLSIIWEGGLKQIVGGFADLITKVTNLTNKFLEANPVINKFLGYIMGAVLLIGLLAPPILLVSGFLLRFRSVIQGVGLAVQAMTARGGIAVLGAQSTMLAKQVHAVTVGLARFPQTLMFGLLPVLYNVIRTLPMFILNMMRINPAMTVLTVGMLAYTKNWFGFGDTVKGAIEQIKGAYNGAKGILDKGINTGEKVDYTQYSKLTEVLAKTMGTAKIAKSVLKSIFSGEQLKFDVGQTNLITSLGIEGAIDKIVKVGKAVKDFTTGFVDGIQLVYDKFKTFFGWMIDTFEPVILRIGNFISKLFGGKGDAKSIEDIMNSANGAGDTMKNLGKMAGVALTALLGFKLIKPLLGGLFKSMIKNPFAGIISSAKTATSAVSTMGRAVGSVATRGQVQRATSASNRDNAVASATGTRALGGGRFASVLRDRNGNATGTVLARNSAPPMNATQQRRADVLTTNANARSRGHDIDAQSAIRRNQPGALGSSFRVNRDGTYNNSNNANLNGQQIHQRRQGRVSRALFGQAYDVYGQDGRRTNINRQGGLLRRSGSDDQIRERMGARNRIAQVGASARTRVTSMGQSAMGGIRSTGTRIANTGAGQRVASAGRAVGNVGRTAMKPVTIPVRYAMARLQTAGLIRQGQQGGSQSGSKFKRAFQMASRGLRVTAGVVGGATQAGAKAGRGMMKGMGFVSKGIGGIFKAGFKLIPFLGWALMAWDIISTIFTNWDKIKVGAQTAWNWIQTSGMDALGNAWTWIQEKASSVWSWIQENGKSTALSIADSVISFLGNAFTFIMGIAGQAIAWILTDGIAMAVKLGFEFLKWIAMDAFPKIVSFAISALTGLITTAGSIAGKIGSAMWDGITSALSGIGDWIGDKLSGALDWVGGLIGGGGGKDPKKHARGGIINAPHMGIVGEAGPEAIIPLSGNQRNRAQMLLGHTAGVLGMEVSNKGEEPSYSNIATDNVPTRTTTSQAPVRSSKSSGASASNGSGSQDNSVTINAVHVNLPQGAQADSTSGRKVAQSLAKELQKILKQERMRSNGKNLTLEDVILNM